LWFQVPGDAESDRRRSRRHQRRSPSSFARLADASTALLWTVVFVTGAALMLDAEPAGGHRRGWKPRSSRTISPSGRRSCSSTATTAFASPSDCATDLLHVAGRLTRHARRLTLHLPAGSPCTCPPTGLGPAPSPKRSSASPRCAPDRSPRTAEHDEHPAPLRTNTPCRHNADDRTAHHDHATSAQSRPHHALQTSQRPPRPSAGMRPPIHRVRSRARMSRSSSIATFAGRW